MNLRLGKFGRQESASAVLLATVVCGCFAIDPTMQFAHGNASYLTVPVAAVLSLLLFEATIAAIRRRGGCSLSCLIGTSKSKALLSVPLLLALLLAAIRPQILFSETVTDFIFLQTDRTNICLYVLPCLLLLTVLGAETLVRASRIFLPLLVLSLLSALLLAIPQYRAYRLYPIPLGAPLSLLSECVRTMFRTSVPLIALLCIGEGTQNIDALRFSGRLGVLIGTALTVAALIGLSLSFSYGQLQKMPSPFYRLLVEVRTENPTMRLDRATLFLWMAISLLSSAFYLYAACVLFAKTFSVRDTRPLACLICVLAVTLVLLLQNDSEPVRTLRSALDRYAWLLIAIPTPLLWIKTGGEGRPCASASCA